jgi:hypothetical protein
MNKAIVKDSRNPPVFGMLYIYPESQSCARTLEDKGALS